MREILLKWSIVWVPVLLTSVACIVVIVMFYIEAFIQGKEVNDMDDSFQEMADLAQEQIKSGEYGDIDGLLNALREELQKRGLQ